MRFEISIDDGLFISGNEEELVDFVGCLEEAIEHGEATGLMLTEDGVAQVTIRKKE